MDSTKTNLLQQQSSPPLNPDKNSRKHLIVSLIILLTIIVAAFITFIALLINHQSKQKINSTYLFHSSSSSIKTLCSFAPYKRLCLAALSSATATNSDNYTSEHEFYRPETFILFSLLTAVTQLTNLSSLPTTLLSKPNVDSPTDSALRECHILFNKELSQLNDSVTAIMDQYRLTDLDIAELVDRFNTTAKNQQACLDKLLVADGGATVVDRVRLNVQKCRRYMRNAVAILSQVNTIYDQFYYTTTTVDDSSYNYYFIYDVFGLEYVLVLCMQYGFLILLMCLMLRMF